MKSKLKYDLLLAAGVFLAAAVLSVFFRPGGTGTWVVVTVEGMETARYPLAEDRTVTLGEEGYNVLRISGGQAAIIDANCGDHTCMNTGPIWREGEAIVCLPHRLMVSIAGGEAAPFDAVAQ